MDARPLDDATAALRDALAENLGRAPAARANALADALSGALPGASAARPATAAGASLVGAGLPHDRHTWAAARRSFTLLRAQCARSLSVLPPAARARWHETLQRTRDPIELAALHPALAQALADEGTSGERARLELDAAMRATVGSAADLAPFGRAR